MAAYLFIVLTVLFWGAAPIFDKVALREAYPLSGLIIRSIAVFLSLIILSFFMKDTFFSSFKLSFKSIILFSLSGVFAGLLGMLTYYSALKSLPSSVVVPLCSVYPLVTALLGMLLLSEGFSWLRLLGVILIIIGVWLVR
ncbi:MAG TPA: hypothetical protein ENI31_05285 [Candidatus Omnitrophica bacterium]|nr:MAG: hypothetical protein DRP61_02510 [Candidatus Omnitrophota bacterium]RKY34886.1 MAG: hypothetical protein DRP69_03350 [Candidatus Omnitrophota bacterium]RKY42802.1 MAG: hypothetical protein DRP80_06330 [Candidatus Omnitrophota bacterium]HEC69675.1 hypothetical protein [Candidatus Omnitrophota bacterium]